MPIGCRPLFRILRGAPLCAGAGGSIDFYRCVGVRLATSFGQIHGRTVGTETDYSLVVFCVYVTLYGFGLLPSSPLVFLEKHRSQFLVPVIPLLFLPNAFSVDEEK